MNANHELIRNSVQQDPFANTPVGGFAAAVSALLALAYVGLFATAVVRPGLAPPPLTAVTASPPTHWGLEVRALPKAPLPSNDALRAVQSGTLAVAGR